MKHITRKLYARVLQQEYSVSFWHKHYFFHIEGASEGGFMVDVYTNDYENFEDKLIHLDGGHCESPNEIDAIEFMLWKSVGEDDWLIWNETTDSFTRFKNGDLIIYGEKQEAKADIIGSEVLIKHTDAYDNLQTEEMMNPQYNPEAVADNLSWEGKQ
jgi:hypothetical protein